MMLNVLVAPYARATVSVNVAINAVPPAPLIDHGTCDPLPVSDPDTDHEPPAAFAGPFACRYSRVVTVTDSVAAVTVDGEYVMSMPARNETGPPTLL